MRHHPHPSAAMAPRRVRRALAALVPLTSRIRRIAEASHFKLTRRNEPSFRCPICGYQGPFADFEHTSHPPIRYTSCPRCHTYERHRLQYLVIQELGEQYDFSRMSILHLAPKPALQREFRRRFDVYHAADVAARAVDFRMDVREMPLGDGSYDIVFASHVLEHVSNDHLALQEIKRVLKPDGFALLPVPVVSPTTIEYPEPNVHEFGHVRAVGADYFERYRSVFSRVEIKSSEDFDEVHQLYTYEDRTIYPTGNSPLRAPMPGDRHPDYVPICFP